MLHSALSKEIIQSFYKVYNALGYGFLEKVYENAMMIEFRKRGLFAEQQKKIWVHYEEEVVGDYYADIIVENKVILELKASKELCEDHENQLLNYLKATDKELGFLLNYGKDPEFVRKIFSNQRKEWWISGGYK
ncbi:MAG: GxxExxY protein [Lewinellaceae bacterium]|nr:GxxExxY protein [Lewinellaceae bacterium]